MVVKIAFKNEKMGISILHNVYKIETNKSCIDVYIEAIGGDEIILRNKGIKKIMKIPRNLIENIEITSV